jgi:hypothetical protein
VNRSIQQWHANGARRADARGRIRGLRISKRRPMMAFQDMSPDSAAAFTITQERDLIFAPDWHPDDHFPMPEVVAT